jgi:hypothetical protein
MLICKYYVVVRAQGGACVRRDDMAVDQVQAYQLGRHGAVIPLPPIRRVVFTSDFHWGPSKLEQRAGTMGGIEHGADTVWACTHACCGRTVPSCVCMHAHVTASCLLLLVYMHMHRGHGASRISLRPAGRRPREYLELYLYIYIYVNNRLI